MGKKKFKGNKQINVAVTELNNKEFTPLDSIIVDKQLTAIDCSW